MDDREGTFVAVRRISQGLDRGSACHSTSGILISFYFFRSIRRLKLINNYYFPLFSYLVLYSSLHLTLNC